MSITQGKAHKAVPNLSITTHDSDDGIFRTLPESSLMSFLCSLTEKEFPCLVLLTVYTIGQDSGSILVISDKLSVVILACSSLLYLLGPFNFPPQSSATHHGNPNELERAAIHVSNSWIIPLLDT